MTSVLMHTCCAPCSLSCIDPLRTEGIEPVAFWYNPHIHPWKEYEARRDCLLAYAPTIEMQVIVDEDYGLRTFVEARCQAILTTVVPTVASAPAGERPVRGGARLRDLYLHPAGQSLSGSRRHQGRGGEIRPAVRRGISLPGFPAQFPGRKSAGQRAWLLYAEVLRLCLFRTGPLPEADRPGQEKFAEQAWAARFCSRKEFLIKISCRESLILFAGMLMPVCPALSWLPSSDSLLDFISLVGLAFSAVAD